MDGFRLHALKFYTNVPDGESIVPGPRTDDGRPRFRLGMTQTEIRGSFRGGWRVEWIRAGRFEAKMDGGGNAARAWVSKITR